MIKLTNKDMETYGGFVWEINKTYELPEKKRYTLCSGDVFHTYKNTNIALLLNPIHASLRKIRIFEAEGVIVAEDWGKLGCNELKLVREVELPEWYNDKGMRKRVQVLFAILCAENVLSFYENYHPDDKRPRKAIEAARQYIDTTTTNHAAADAADAAAYAADVLMLLMIR